MNNTRFQVQKHWRNIVYSNVWIALGAAGATWQTNLLIGSLDLILPFFIGFSTLLTYNFQRLVKLTDRPEYAAGGRNNWLFRNRKLLGLISVLAVIPCVVLLPKLTTSAMLILSISGVLSLFYAVRFFPIAGRLRALRDIAYLKLYVIALVWALVTVALPLVQLNGFDFDLIFFARFAERFAFIAAVTIPFDIRDMHLDHRSQRTVVHLFGQRGARIYAIIWIGISLVAATILWFSEVYTFSIWLAISLSLAIAAVAISKASSDKEEMFFTAGIDGTLLLQAVLVSLSVLF